MKTAADQLHPQFIKDGGGKDSFVVLPTKEYERLLEDMASIAERRTETTMGLDDLRTKLAKDGLL